MPQGVLQKGLLQNEGILTGGRNLSTEGFLGFRSKFEVCNRPQKQERRRRGFFCRGQATAEYALLLIFVLGAFLILQKYIVRAFSGRWKAAGDSFGEGHIYDPNETLECAVDTRFPNDWYDVACFKVSCKNICFGVHYNEAACRSCIQTTCHNPMCDD